MPDPDRRPRALLTGVGRRAGIAAGIALGLARDGWDLVINFHRPYDERLDLIRGDTDPEVIADECRGAGAEVTLAPADVADPAACRQLIDHHWGDHGLQALIMSHCESVDSSILTTTVESWDRHFAVNARASWLLIKAYAERLPVLTDAPAGTVAGRIIALTSDHTTHNLPYGASKGALDRLVIAAAAELADRGVRANVINPGPVDTGWMDDAIRASGVAATPAGRLGTPSDIADLVCFLCSPRGGWINAQLLYANGGFATG